MESTRGLELVNALRGPSPHYKRAALDAVFKESKLTTPHLLALLQEIVEQPERHSDPESWDMAPLYALVAVSRLQLTAAHPLVLQLCRLDHMLLGGVFGDLVTEGLPGILYLTCGGDIEGIAALLADSSADGYVRAAAAMALAFTVLKGVAPRDRVLQLLSDQLVPDAADFDSFMWTGVAEALMDLHATECREALLAAVDQDLIEPMFYIREDIERLFAGTGAEGRQNLECRFAEEIPASAHDVLCLWSCFQADGAFALPGKPGRSIAKVRSDRKAHKKRQKAARKHGRKGKKKR